MAKSIYDTSHRFAVPKAYSRHADHKAYKVPIPIHSPRQPETHDTVSIKKPRVIKLTDEEDEKMYSDLLDELGDKISIAIKQWEEYIQNIEALEAFSSIAQGRPSPQKRARAVEHVFQILPTSVWVLTALYPTDSAANEDASERAENSDEAMETLSRLKHRIVTSNKTKNALNSLFFRNQQFRDRVQEVEAWLRARGREMGEILNMCDELWGRVDLLRTEGKPSSGVRMGLKGPVEGLRDVLDETGIGRIVENVAAHENGPGAEMEEGEPIGGGKDGGEVTPGKAHGGQLKD